MAATAENTQGALARVGRYEILGEIASGGMATVYLGRATGAKGFARLVAIKRLHPHLINEEEFVSMFLDEARLAARIRHPNAVPTLDVDDSDGLYIVMEYVEGDRLLGLLRYEAKKGSRIPAGIALRIGVETLQGLHAAHELTDDDGKLLQIVHRDVSPQNVLIGVDGVTKITDFGIAKAESRLSQTRDGQLKGKIAYMAPEQTRRTNIDRRVDVFAAGILVWEMFTGRRLFKGDNDVEVLNAVVNEPIPTPRSVVPEIPVELDDVIMKALEREPDKRFSTAQEFADALEHVAHTMGGLAATRTVAEYVRMVAGPKLQAERARFKQTTVVPGTMTAPAGLSDQPSQPSHPRPTTERSGVRPPPNAMGMGAAESTGALPAVTPETTAGATMNMVPAPAAQKSSKAGLIGAFVGVAGLAAALGIWAAGRNHQGATTVIVQQAPPTSAANAAAAGAPNNPAPTAPAANPAPTAPTAGTAPAADPAAAAAATDNDAGAAMVFGNDETAAGGNAAGRHGHDRHGHDRTTATQTAQPAQTPTPTPAPARPAHHASDDDSDNPYH